MSRWAAVLLAVVGGAAGAWAATLALFGALLGFLWIYVFGDDPWPAWVDPVVGTAVVVVGVALWGFFGLAIWRRIRRI